MAAKSIEEPFFCRSLLCKCFILRHGYFQEKPFLSGRGGGSTNVPVNIACFELIKPSFDETNHHCSLGKDFCVRYDVLPILIEETSFPVREKCSLNTSHGQDVYSISLLPEEGNTSPKCTPQLTFLSLLEVPFPSKNQMRLDAKLSCRNCIDLKVDGEDAYSSCILDTNIEKELPDILTSSDEIVGNSKTEGVLTVCKHILLPISNNNFPILPIIDMAVLALYCIRND
ncbi:hypothetical protein GOBAR_DD01452 [Gossypium barbadense]|nr:hypothetical protein GOBAR_DD01452 [Gossypium barbadense]